MYVVYWMFIISYMQGRRRVQGGSADQIVTEVFPATRREENKTEEESVTTLKSFSVRDNSCLNEIKSISSFFSKFLSTLECT